MKKGRSALIFALAIVSVVPELQAQSVAQKATRQRESLILVLRSLRPMAYNFPCDPMPDCMPKSSEDRAKNPGVNVELYRKAKRLYQEGLIYFYEKNFVNAYSRLLEAQMTVDKVLEYLSEIYLDRAEIMLRQSVEKKNSNDPNDMSVVDISMDFGPGSKMRRDFSTPRSVQYDVRRYDPRNYHWAVNRYQIEKNMEKGYDNLGAARKVREKALKLDTHLPPEERNSVDILARRIELYQQVIELARAAKINAEFIYALKYPYANYPLTNPWGKTEKIDDKPGEIPALLGIKMNWSKNPNVFPKRLHPIFDFRVPEDWHRDTVDARNLRYEDELDVQMRFRYHKKQKPVEILEDKSGQPTGKERLPDT